MEYVFLGLFAVAAAAGFYFLFTRRKIAPKSAGSGWSWLNSPGMGAVTNEGGWNVFSFPTGGEAHMLVRKVGGPLSGRIKLRWKFDGSVRPVQGSAATVSLIIIRKGNTWKQSEYRWYWAGLPIAGDLKEIDAPLAPELWVNVDGKKGRGNDKPHEDNPEAFFAALANAEYVGPAFGDPGAGATAHGVKGSGKFSFTLEVAL